MAAHSTPLALFPSSRAFAFLSPSFLLLLLLLRAKRAALYRLPTRGFEFGSLPPSPILSLALSFSLHPVSRSRERCCVRYIVYTSVPSLNKLLFIRPVAEMNLRDSYRTRPDMHDGFESLSFPPNVFSQVIDRRMNVPSFLRNPRKINTREKGARGQS